MPFKKVCTLILMGFLLLSSYRCASSTQKYFREHTKDVREITTFLQAIMPRRVYADWISIEQIYFYSGFTFNNLHNINDMINNPRKDCYVVLGGSRGAGLVADYFEKDYLQLINNIPGHWIALKTIHGTRDSFRHRDITVYYVPNDTNNFSSTNEQNL